MMTFENVCWLFDRWLGGASAKSLIHRYGRDPKTMGAWLKGAKYAYARGRKRHVRSSGAKGGEPVGIERARGLMAILAADEALNGEDRWFSCPCTDVLGYGKEPSTDVVEALATAMRERCRVNFDYISKKREISGAVSPHRFVRTAFRSHVRGAVTLDGSPETKFRDLVLTRFTRVELDRSTSQESPRDDHDWLQTRDLAFVIDEDQNDHLAQMLGFENEVNGSTLTVRAVPIAMERYIREIMVFRRYGHEREDASWSEQK